MPLLLTAVESWLLASPRPEPALNRGEATSCLAKISGGDDPTARHRLFEILYDDLRAQAAALMKDERATHTLQPTALVHEAWLRLIDPTGIRIENRHHFLALASKAMRHVLVDHARGKAREKRGRGWKRIEFGEELREEHHPELDVLEIDAALSRLGKQSSRLASLVEMRFFAGLSREESADALGVSRATATRMWRVAKAEMSHLLKRQQG